MFAMAQRATSLMAYDAVPANCSSGANCSTAIVSVERRRCFIKLIYRAKRSRDATKRQLSDPMSGVQNCISCREPL